MNLLIKLIKKIFYIDYMFINFIIFIYCYINFENKKLNYLIYFNMYIYMKYNI